MTYLTVDQLKPGYLYRLRSRNLALGVYREDCHGFVGIREKFDSLFLFTEYHYDTGGSVGTAMPEEELEPCPVTDLRESLGTECGRCKTRAWFEKFSDDFPAPDEPYPGQGRWRCEGGCWEADPYGGASKGGTEPWSMPNKALYDWLIERERAASESFREYHDAYLQGEEAVDALKERRRAEYWAGEAERAAARQAQEKAE